MSNLQFIATFSAMMICILWLSACTGTGGEKKESGSLICLGYCDLKIDNTDTEVEVRADGARIERHKRSGLKRTDDEEEENDEIDIDSVIDDSHGPGRSATHPFE